MGTGQQADLARKVAYQAEYYEWGIAHDTGIDLDVPVAIFTT